MHKRRVKKKSDKKEARTYIVDIFEHDKRRPLRLWLVPYAYLPYAAVASEEIVQVFAGDLVVEVLDEQDAVCARWKLCLPVGKTM
jgi:hypothetical protein